jgi:SAM-dependent methyltransferase
MYIISNLNVNNLKLLLKNIKNYGLKDIILIILFEGIYSLNFKFRKHIFYDETCTDSYKNIKLKKSENENFKTSIEYNSPYSPTPIHFLRIVKKEVLKISSSLDKYCFIDFGCGAGRSIFFFRDVFKKKIGIDINERFKKYFKNDKFLNLNLRDFDDVKVKLTNIDSNFFLLYFYEPFDEGLVEKYIKLFTNKEVIVVTINVKPIIDDNLNAVFKKEFPNKKRNIIIYINKILKNKKMFGSASSTKSKDSVKTK